ncbi:conserved hypothetical protein [Culex quinquefasciatus]|uniref:Uncharacterized protein n=1 Tax=Culex quinquefasciatus TaxID=7176 RepID=B0WQP6_CULQU|nr:conserved hypothetical protein [Culex quinquefasciatus]|eukprot:XP_001851030.1 conserved hypothetical protein [Culex quinquefasciatus]
MLGQLLRRPLLRRKPDPMLDSSPSEKPAYPTWTAAQIAAAGRPFYDVASIVGDTFPRIGHYCCFRDQGYRDFGGGGIFDRTWKQREDQFFSLCRCGCGASLLMLPHDLAHEVLPLETEPTVEPTYRHLRPSVLIFMFFIGDEKMVFIFTGVSDTVNRKAKLKFSCISTLIGYGLSYSSRAVQILSVTSDYLMPPTF